MNESRTATQGRHSEHRRFASSLGDIRQLADDVSELSHAELRRRIDEVHTWVLKRFLPHLGAEDARERLEASRLVEKLEALRERLVYSYFGQEQLGSLQELLYDLYTVMELHLVKAAYVPAVDRRVRLPHFTTA